MISLQLNHMKSDIYEYQCHVKSCYFSYVQNKIKILNNFESEELFYFKF